MCYKSKFFLIILLNFLFNAVYSQDLVTDRPDQTESSVTVPKGTLQWESGYWFEKDTKSLSTTNKRIQSLGFNSTLLRYGIFEKIELRLGSDIVKKSVSQDDMGLWLPSSTATNLEPMYLGFKINLLDEKGIIPEIAILGHLSIPMLSTTDEEDIAPDLTLSGSYTLSQSMGFGFNIGSHWSGFGTGYPDIFYSAVLGISHGEKLGSYWEIYGWEYADLEQSDLRADAGLTYLVKSNLQLDFSGGIGLSEMSPDFFVNLGFSWRIPE